MRHGLHALLMVLFTCAVAWAQEPVRVISVDWGASPPLPPERLAEVSGLRVGEPLTREGLARAVRALSDLREVLRAAVRTVPASPGWVEVRVALERARFVQRVQITGATRLGHDAVRRAARVNPGDRLEDTLPDEVARRVRTVYAARGYFDTRVQVQPLPPAEGADPGQVVLLVQVEEGSRAHITRLRFPGFPGRGEREDLPFLLRLSVRAGTAFDSTRLQADLEKIGAWLERRGYLHPQVGPYRLEKSEGGVEVIVPVRARERVEVAVTGRHRPRARTVRNVLQLASQQVLNESVLEEARRRLLDYLRQEGYLEARANLSLTRVPEEDLYRVTAHVERGRRIRTGNVRFTGNRTFDDDQLYYLVHPRWGLLPEPISEARIAERADRIEGALRAAGYPEAAVTPTLEPVPDQADRMGVVYHVAEGRRWWIGRVDLEGTEGLPEPAQVKARELAGELSDSVYRRDRVNRGRAALSALAADHGFIDATVETGTARNEVWRGQVAEGGEVLREVVVDLTYRITPGPQVRIGEVTLRGEFRTRPYVIQREFAFAPGDLYTPAAIAETRRRLFRTAALDQVRIGPADPEDRDNVRDVVVQVAEGKPGAVEVGLGYAEEDGVREMLDVSYRDLFRRGHRGNVRLRNGRLLQSVTVGYFLPWVGRYRMGLTTRFQYEREDLISYKRVTHAAEAGIRRQLGGNLSAALVYRLERNRFPLLPADQVALLPERRRINVGSLSGSLTRDTRDDPFSPARGTLVSAGYEQGARVLLSQVQFAKATLHAAAFHPTRGGAVLAASLRTGRVQNLFQSITVPVSERFFLGGHSTVRGYSLDSVGVPGETVISGVPQGGLVSVLVNLELRMGGRQGWGTALFVDAGNVWNRAGNIGLSDFRVGAGPGLHYATPIGPMRLDLGYKIDRRRGESVWRLHFTIGNTF